MIFWTKIKLALAFQRALGYEEEHRYQKVINTLEKYRSFVDKKLPIPFSEYFILLGRAYCGITNYRLAEGCLISALEHIKDESKFNEDEKNYLKYHTYYWLYFVYKNLYDNVKAEQCQNLFKKVNFNLKNVRKYFKTSFPIDN